jgi:uncharacterized integral membrane protein
VHDDQVNDWLRARNGWALLLLLWGIVLMGGLLGVAASRTLYDSTTSFASHVPWVVGGSLFVALSSTVRTVRRRRRQG